jgi:hypothetical protein
LYLTTQTQNATMTFANAVYNPTTGRSSNAISIAPPPHYLPCRGGLRFEGWAGDESLA